MTVLKRTKKAMCLVKLMELLGLKETLDRIAKASGLLRYGHVLTRGSNDNLRAIDFKHFKKRARETVFFFDAKKVQIYKNIPSRFAVEIQ